MQRNFVKNTVKVVVHYCFITIVPVKWFLQHDKQTGISTGLHALIELCDLKGVTELLWVAHTIGELKLNTGYTFMKDRPGQTWTCYERTAVTTPQHGTLPSKQWDRWKLTNQD